MKVFSFNFTNENGVAWWDTYATDVLHAFEKWEKTHLSECPINYIEVS